MTKPSLIIAIKPSLIISIGEKTTGDTLDAQFDNIHALLAAGGVTYTTDGAKRTTEGDNIVMTERLFFDREETVKVASGLLSEIGND